MKIHRQLVNGAAHALKEIFAEKRHADKVLERLFRSNPVWGSRDRKFIAGAVYDITRYFRKYCFITGSENNYWNMTGAWMVLEGMELPEWQEFKALSAAHVQKMNALAARDRRVGLSYPDWLWQTATDELGEAVWNREAEALNSPAEVYLRANTLKNSAAQLVDALKKENIDAKPVAGVDGALTLEKRMNVFQTSAFREGLFEVQDAGSQVIGQFADPRPGDVVIDACAGAGGKSLQLAALMKNKGRVVSMDVNETKLDELRKRARRAGAFNIEARIINDETVRDLTGKADLLLLDVPCSGTGVLRRNPDAKWKLAGEVLERTRVLQRQILSDYHSMLRPGGTLVYSTCSILPSENESQADWFAENFRFKKIEERSIMPSSGFDGFYMCRLAMLTP